MKFYHLQKVIESINNGSIYWRNGVWSPNSIHVVGYQYYKLTYKNQNEFLGELKNGTSSFFIQIGNKDSKLFWHIPTEVLNNVLYNMEINKVD